MEELTKEIDELNGRIKNLRAFINLNPGESLLIIQLSAMETYLKCLTERFNKWH